MSLTILASVSLLALVSSARPIQPYHARTDSVQSFLNEDNEDFRQVIQSVVRTHASVPEEIRIGDDIHVQLTTVEKVQAFLLTAQEDAVKAVIRLNHGLVRSPHEQEQELHDLLSHFEGEGQTLLLSDDTVDNETVMSPIASSDGLPGPDDEQDFLVTEGRSELRKVLEDADAFPNLHLVVLLYFTLVLTAVAAIVIMLHLIDVLRARALEATKELFPYFQENTISSQHAKISTEKAPHLIHDNESEICEKILTPLSDDMTARNILDERIPPQGPRSPGSASLSGEPLIVIDELETPILGRCNAQNPLVATPTQAIAERSSAISVEKSLSFEDFAIPGGMPMLELEAQRPSWFTRASEASALARAGDNGERRHGYGQHTVPGLDAALAMQLRPGFGASGDTAWLVRFIMALFGWCAVLMSGSSNHL